MITPHDIKVLQSTEVKTGKQIITLRLNIERDEEIPKGATEAQITGIRRMLTQEIMDKLYDRHIEKTPRVETALALYGAVREAIKQ